MTPNLFILGAGKCGTTSLHAILGQHPDIHASRPKEPSFFCHPFQVVKDPISYFRLFDSPKVYRMEASHAYFSNPDTAPVLKSLFPDARFIVILREPRARAYSLYRTMRAPLPPGWGDKPYEPIETFHEALAAEDGRFASAEFAADCPQYFWNFMYCRSGLYDKQLQRYFALFDRDQFCIVTLATLATYPLGTTAFILRFLGLDPAPAKDFDFRPLNQAGEHPQYSLAAEAIMAPWFDGLTERVDRLVGQRLDWSR